MNVKLLFSKRESPKDHGRQNLNLDRRIAQFYDFTSPKRLGSH